MSIVQIMKIILSLVLCIFLFENCQNESKHTTTVSKTIDSTETVPQMVYDHPTLLFTTKMDSMETPRTVVSFAFGKTVEKIDIDVVGEFHLLEAIEKKQMKLPKSYIVAGSAFWAGLQVVIAIDSTSNGYAIMRQYQDEGGSGKEKFERIKTFPK